jgi:putative transposase
VVMPDHMHLLFEILSKKTVSEIMHDVKSHIAYEMSSNNHRRSCHASSGLYQATRSVAASGMEKRFIRVWHRSFYDHVIENDRDLYNHVQYIRNNPVKARLVRTCEDYPWVFVCADSINSL